MPNYVVQMSKDGGNAFKVMDEEARSAIAAEVTARQGAVAAETSARQEAVAAETSARQEAVAAETSARETQVSDLKSSINEQQSGVLDGVVRFDTSGYYTGVDTISSNVNYKCCQIAIPANLNQIRVYFNQPLDSQYYVVMLLDKNRNLIGSMKGTGYRGSHVMSLVDYPEAAYAQINDFGDYYYNDVELCYFPISSELEIGQAYLAGEKIGRKPDCTFTGGKLIWTSLQVADTRDGWQISSPIQLNAGEIITVKCLGYLNMIAIISRCDANGNLLECVAPSYGAEGAINEYTYKAGRSEYVKLCFNTDEPWSVVISNATKGTTENIASTGTIITGYWCNNDGEIAAFSAGAYIKLPIPENAKHLTVAYPQVWTSPEKVSDGFVGKAIYLDDQSANIGSQYPQTYKNLNPCDGIYTATFPVMDGAAYFCMTTRLSAWDEGNSIVIVNGNQISFVDETINELNGVPFSDEKLREKLKAAETNDWSAYTWLLVGDSLTEKNIRAVTSYYDYISKDTGVSFINKGHSGLGYKRNNWFYTALTQVDGDDFDFCTFFGSGNDLYKLVDNVPVLYTEEEWPEALGTVSDTGTSTICGCINRTFDKFIELFPLKKFGVVTPTPWNGFNNPDGTINGTFMDDYSNKLIEICRNRGIPCLDLYHMSGLRPWDEDFRLEYYNENSVQDDGVHPNSKGHKWIYPMFKQFLKQFIVTP